MISRRIQFPDFKRKIERLAQSLLPKDRVSDSYTDQEKDQIHAYLVLAHAEIEDFLERLAMYVADRARRDSIGAKCSPVISRLILFQCSRSTNRIEPATEESIKGAYKFYENLVEHNHGIKADNLFRLFMPLGMTHSDFDPVLLSSLDTFGNLRGGIAHTAAKLQQGSSPSSEKKRVEDIVAALAHVDQRVRNLK